MGVTGLWTVLQPCARPIKLEALNKKRLAIDASIWIYQFLKAVRDKEGNALRNSHVVGFFRRICKLLFIGIKPVFVFDGGAPMLKRETIANRKKRREGRREDAVRTAGRLLATQMKRAIEDERAAHRRGKNRGRAEEEEPVPDNPVYVEDTFRTNRERKETRQFKRTDPYHLPTLDVSLEEMGAPNDPRVMSREELEEYARQFQQGEDVNLYDFSKIDFDSPFFLSLPATDRYNILNAARLRSRLRMGYSKEQLESMFPDRMAFSKFQIERVKERNDLTQRLMNINGMNPDDGFATAQRVAGERNREYVLVKDSAVEGGWALGVVSDHTHGGQADKPIDVDHYGQFDVLPEEAGALDDEDGFEDVPIEGLNRLSRSSLLQRRSSDNSGREVSRDIEAEEEDDALFVIQADEDEHHGAQRHQDRDDADSFFEESGGSEDENLQHAIEMSLKSPEDTHIPGPLASHSPSAVAVTETHSESDSEDVDFATALAQSKKPQSGPSNSRSHPFDGPLPFESIKLGKAHAAKDETTAGTNANDGKSGKSTGTEKSSAREAENEASLPPWFSGVNLNEQFITDKTEDDTREKYREHAKTANYEFLKEKSPDVIVPEKSEEIIDVESSPAKESEKELEEVHESTGEGERRVESRPATPPVASPPASARAAPKKTPEAQMKDVSDDREEFYEWDATDDEAEFEDVAMGAANENAPETGDAEPALEPQTAIDTDQLETIVEGDETSDPEDPEEEDLMRQLAEEAEEHARFAATLNPTSQPQSAFDYQQELKQLRAQQQKDRRDADEVTQVMITECQQLLGLFGLPYITAPMEAEAQCAELVSLGLVDGIVTDDSDVFLFGGTRVYKNMFNQNKFVECYLMSDLEKEYALYRRNLISFAHLLGSDYTEGIPGVGPVTALEIVSEFPRLEEFRDWWNQLQSGILDSHAPDSHKAFYKKFRKSLSKIFLPPSFPDLRVDAAYLGPEVDADPMPFQWGVPDLTGLRSFLMATIGWSPERTDEILLPVIRDMNRREEEGTQSNISNFISGPQGAGVFAPRARRGGKSRMEKAFSRLHREAETGGHDSAEEHNNDTSRMEHDANRDDDDDNNKKRRSRAQQRKGQGTKRWVTRNESEGDGENNNATDQKISNRKKRKTAV